MIIAAVAAAAAALVIYWEPVSAFFTDLFARLGIDVNGVWEVIKTVFAWSPLGLIVSSWQPIGDYIDGLVGGISSTISDVFAAIEAKMATVKSILDWGRGVWGKLFPDGSIPSPAAPVAAAATAAAAAVPVTAGLPAPQPVKVVPVLPTAAVTPSTAAAAPAARAQQSVAITVNAAPGMSAEDVAKEVRKQLEQLAARDRSSARSAMYDR